METDWHPLWISYEWWRDIGMPGLSGVGGILVGLGAIAVAWRTHTLAKQVRADEHKRDADSARDRYRDELFRTIEPAVTALLDHRAAIAIAKRVSIPDERGIVARTLGQLNMVDAVANEDDRALVSAVLRAYQKAVSLKDLSVLTMVLGGLAFSLARLLSEEHDVALLVRSADNLVSDSIRETSPTL